MENMVAGCNFTEAPNNTLIFGPGTLFTGEVTTNDQSGPPAEDGFTYLEPNTKLTQITESNTIKHFNKQNRYSSVEVNASVW